MWCCTGTTKLPAWIRYSVTERSVSNSFQTHFHNVERNKREKRRSKNRREHGGIHICKELDKSTKQLNHNPQSMTETNKQVQHSGTMKKSLKRIKPLTFTTLKATCLGLSLNYASKNKLDNDFSACHYHRQVTAATSGWITLKRTRSVP